MRADEFLSEVTKPDAPPPKPGDPEFEKSKQSFIKIIQQAVAEYSKNLNDKKTMAPSVYKSLIQDRAAIVQDFQKTILQTLKDKGNQFITDRDMDDVGLNRIKISTGAKKRQQAANVTTTAATQTAQQPTSTQTLSGLKPGDTGYAALAAALERQKAKNTKVATGESIEEARLNLTTNAIVLTPSEIDSLATRATQVWYRNRQLKAKNPKLWAQLSGKNTDNNLANSSGSNTRLLATAVGTNPQSPQFAQQLINIISQPTARAKLIKTLHDAGIDPEIKNS